MKLILFLTGIFCFHVSAAVLAQEVNMKGQKMKLTEALSNIQRQTGYDIFFKKSLVENRRMDVDIQRKSISETLNILLKGQGLDYSIVDKTIVLKEANAVHSTLIDIQQTYMVSGTVVGENDKPLSGVTVSVKGTTLAVATNENGAFSLELKESPVYLVFSSIGLKSVERKVSTVANLSIKLVPEVSEMDDVVINGYFERRKESFTGNSRSFSGADLITMSPTNVIKSLALLDPSIQLLENNSAGSNPNATPQIRFRGDSQFQGFESVDKSGLVGDPNMPVFILDGFQSTLQAILDIDMYRIESVTILKDAAATAIYGSRASNGVIVVKTKQPKSGELQINYNLDVDVNLPDLRGYNLLDAKENLEMYDRFNMYRNDDGSLRPQYNMVSRWVAEGVNTDWLAQPLRNAIGHKHSLNLMGGDQHLRYGFNSRYGKNNGVMKGSSRENVGVGANLQYNLNDKIQFSNNLTFDKNNQQESPYGAFRNYALINAFYPIYDENGRMMKYYTYTENGVASNLWGNANIPVNPLYEASVGNMNNTNLTTVMNNFAFDWAILQNLRFRSQLSYTGTLGNTINFTSPASTTYQDYIGNLGTIVDLENRGRYQYSDTKGHAYNVNSVLSYSKAFHQHFVNISLGGNLNEQNNAIYGFVAQGFGAGVNPEPAFAKGYEIGGTPSSSKGTIRIAGLFASGNYSYANRYLLDVNYRLDGSSQFGNNTKSAPFYSVGAGWNIHQEQFMKNQSFFNKVRLRSTFGETGSVSFAPYQSKDMYSYYTNSRYDGNLGVYLLGMGNPNLSWQKVLNREVGGELSFLDNRFDLNITYYNNKTIDMVLPVTAPPSMGFESVTANLGKMSNKGTEVYIRAMVVKKDDFNVSVYGSAMHNKNKILAISSALDAYNKSIDNRSNYSNEREYQRATHQLLTRYEENQSTTAIYAVRSLGIDPMSGEELFLNRDGIPTSVWSADDKVVVGDTNPGVRGTAGLNGRWKGFYVNITFTYQLGGQIYNQTLVDKVENSNKFLNVDKRVLYDTWQNVGDEVNFKANLTTRLTSPTTFASSRFVQDYSFLNIGAASIQYDAPQVWAAKIHMKSLRLAFNMADFGQFSTIRRERGTNYPFARSFSLGLRSNF